MLMTPNSISPPESKEAVDVLNRCLEAVGSWMWENKLKLNSHKTEVFLVWKSMARVLDYCPALNGVALSEGAGTQLAGSPGSAVASGVPGVNCGKRRLCSASAALPASTIPESLKSSH